MKNIKNILRKINENNFDKMINEIKEQKNNENKLFLLIFIITGFSFLFNNIAPLITIFLIFYYEANKRKILGL